MIFDVVPADFKKKFEVASCFVVNKKKALYLKRSTDKTHGGCWGIPAGKVEKNEETLDAAIRETEEETGICLEKNNLTFFKTLYVRYPDYDFVYHIFSLEYKDTPQVNLNRYAHTDYLWLEPEEALKLKLIPDEDLCIKLFFDLN